jgi:hypothetical protein
MPRSHGRPDSSFPHTPLHTATAIGDPVLVRVETPDARLVLLAADATCDTADRMTLHDVRCVRKPRGVLSRLRRPRETRLETLDLRRVNGRHLVASPTATLAASPFSFPMKNLTALQHQAYRGMSPAGLLAVGRSLLAGRIPPATKRPLLQRLRIALAKRTVAAAQAR